MDRKEMIRRLTDATLETVLSEPDLATLRSMLAQGFGGFESMSEKRLHYELQLFGLLEFDEPEPAEEFDDDEDDEDEDDERTATFALTPGLCVVSAQSVRSALANARRYNAAG